MTATALQMHRLLQLRWTEITGQTLAILVAVFGLALPLRSEGLFSICLILAALNLFSHWRLTQKWLVTQAELFLQLCIDVLALALLLYQSGGSSNPFSSLLLVPLTITATLLSARWVWAMAGVTAASYSILMFWHQALPTPAMPLDGLNDFICTVTGLDRSLLNHDNGFSLHVVGMWINFLLSAAIVTVFITRLASVLRERDQELAKARENTLRHERVLALGTLAAGAAHQLGTPLATMAVVLHELQLAHAAEPAMKEDLDLLRGQVDQCKSILAGIVDKASQAASGTVRPIKAVELIHRILDQWNLLRPGIAITFSPDGECNDFTILDDPGLEQAVLNLLDNAADACQKDIRLHLFSRQENGHQFCCLEIIDRGSGIDDELLQQLGEPFITTKGDAGGMGIGFFLTNATLDRLGGKVEIFNREDGGACTRITMPCLS